MPEDAAAAQPVLEVSDLGVSFRTPDGDVEVLKDVSLAIGAGETLGVVGESGSGKSLTSAAIMGLLPANASVTGSVRFRGTELIGATEKELRELRGNRISLIAQDALTALNPVHTVGRQIEEAIWVHHGSLTRKQLRERAIELLDLVGIPQPAVRVDSFPHEFSGGMRQRALIAMGVANEPDLVIADEPTTALDVTVQAQVLDVLERIQDRTSSSLMLITHDLGVVAGVADRVLVMYSGSPVEDGDVDDVFAATGHPYTRGLLASLPRLDSRDRSAPLYRIPGSQPSPSDRPSGCSFHPRCSFARPGLCEVQVPQAVPLSGRHTAACHLAGEDAVQP